MATKLKNNKPCPPVSLEQRQKQSIARKKYYQNLSQEQKIILSKKYSEGQKNRWKKITLEQKEIIYNKTSNSLKNKWKNLSEEEKNNIIEKNKKDYSDWVNSLPDNIRKGVLNYGGRFKNTEPNKIELFVATILKTEYNLTVQNCFSILTENQKHKYYMDILVENKIDLEIDGPHHEFKKEKDMIRDKWIKSQGYIVYRIKYTPKKIEMLKEIKLFVNYFYK